MAIGLVVLLCLLVAVVVGVGRQLSAFAGRLEALRVLLLRPEPTLGLFASAVTSEFTLSFFS